MPLALIIIIAIGAVAGLLFVVSPNEQEYIEATGREVDTALTQESAQPVQQAESAVTHTTPAEKNTYNNGTYTANATYFTPKRVQHNISVSVTINNDIITDADVLYDDAEAKTPSHIGFDGAYEQRVLGAEVDNLDLARVGGASLTTTAFNEALADITSNASL